MQRPSPAQAGRWILVLLACAALSAESRQSLPLAQNLALEGRQAANDGQPLIVLFSLPGCPHCEVVRRSHLLPMLTRMDPAPHIRQIDIGSRAPLRDFQGKPATHGEFAQRQGINLTPVVVFLDAEGHPLAEPLVGSLLPDYYAAYLEQAITQSRARLVAARPKKP